MTSLWHNTFDSRNYDKKFGQVGWCGLKYHHEEDIVEVGYRFFEEYWGKGYATEACKAVISYGFISLRVQKIYAFSDVKNIRSINVLEKSGMKLLDTILREGIRTRRYYLNNTYITVKRILAAETYPVRQQVLRQGKPIASCMFDGDEEKTTIHLGLFFYGTLSGVVSYIRIKTEYSASDNQYQLRGMAILLPFQGKKLGEVLLSEGERILKELNCNFIWCNSREVAVNFYKRNGFVVEGESFVIPSIGVHYKMHKKL